MNKLEIARMSTVERLQTMEALWDSLIHKKTEPESPEWHQDILVARTRKITEGEAEFISLKKLKSKQNR